MDQTSPWVPQEDGTYLPSAELVKAVRENPDQYPNALDDFTALSGKSREEVQAILDNPLAAGGYLSGPVVGPIAKVATFPDVRRGLAEAGGWAAKKLGFGDAGQAIQDYGQTLNPQFDTERAFGDKLAEIGDRQNLLERLAQRVLIDRSCESAGQPCRYALECRHQHAKLAPLRQLHSQSPACELPVRDDRGSHSSHPPQHFSNATLTERNVRRCQQRHTRSNQHAASISAWGLAG